MGRMRARLADRSPETVVSPSSGLDAAWAHPVLGRLLRGQRRQQGLDRRHPWLFDTVVVLAVAAVSLPDVFTGGDEGPFGGARQGSDVPTWVMAVGAIALVLPLWWRRRAPAVAFFAISLISLVQWSLGIWQQAGVSLLVALYSLALRGSLRTLAWAAGLIVLETTLAVCVLVPVDRPLIGLFFLLGTTTAAVALGLTFRTRRLYMAALEDRADRLEIEREQRERLMAATERSRVAREMHDIVGHNLSVMVGLADGAATLAAHGGPEPVEALRLIGDTGRQAMGELRRTLGVLRERPEDASLSPLPGIGDLDALLTRVRAAGLKVTYRTGGDPAALGDGVQLTVFRIVQEALTNTLKHAGAGAVAEVTVAVENGGVQVRVTDSGPGRGEGPPPATEPGHGVVGIRQRAAMYGGTVTIGPRDGTGGWVVDVLLDAPAGPEPGERAP
ncbi:two-component sensor histidine kinase [Streptomyces sp. S3(2020)]|nr:two-component sensor histidine kinase [Streptomyces sp. S3(2020)]